MRSPAQYENYDFDGGGGGPDGGDYYDDSDGGGSGEGTELQDEDAPDLASLQLTQGNQRLRVYHCSISSASMR